MNVAPSGGVMYFCPEVKGMPSFDHEWLKIKEGKTVGNPKKISPTIFALFHKNECMISAC